MYVHLLKICKKIIIIKINIIIIIYKMKIYI